MSEKQNGKRGLQPIHEGAIDRLITGASVTKTAKELGVSRQTVSGWLNHDETFREAYNECRLQSREAITNRLLSLVPKATQVLERKLAGPQGLQAAAHVIRAAAGYADTDLREAKFHQLMNSTVLKDLLKVVRELSKTNNQNFRSLMQALGGTTGDPKT